MLYDTATLSLRLTKLIGREAEIEQIREAISRKDHNIVISIWGHGGIGKTRLLEEIALLRHDTQLPPFRWSDIIDLNLPRFHHPEDIREEIVERLDKNAEFFPCFREKSSNFDKQMSTGLPGEKLEALRKELEACFLDEFAQFADQIRPVICLDTSEVLEYEQEKIHQVLGQESESLAVKNWVTTDLVRLPKTLVLIAGRPRKKLDEDIQRAFLDAGWEYLRLELPSFNHEQGVEYFRELETQYHVQNVIALDDPSLTRPLVELAKGRPNRLSLFFDLLRYGEDSLSFINTLPPQDQLVEDRIDDYLFDRLRRMMEPDGPFIPFDFMLYARKGIDSRLLAHKMGSQPNDPDIQAMIEQTRQLTFVKSRVINNGTGEIELSLHDELYDHDDRMSRNRPPDREFRQNLEYYKGLLKQKKLTPAQEQSWNLARLYYQLRVDYKAGWELFEQLSAEALYAGLVDYYRRLREEYLRFRARFTSPKSDYCAEWATSIPLDAGMMDRQAAARLAEYYIALGENLHAGKLIEQLQQMEQAPFQWEQLKDPVYQARLLLALVKAGWYSGASQDEGMKLLQNVHMVLNTFTPTNEDQFWWQQFLMGMYHNFFGFQLRLKGEMAKAVANYREALSRYRKIKSDYLRAGTLVNLSYPIALMGDVETAESHILDALEIWKRHEAFYRYALALNTLGLIMALQDRPIVGTVRCNEALDMMEPTGVPHGIGLVKLGQGFCKRRQADMWKSNLIDVPIEKAAALFKEAEGDLQAAQTIFLRIEEWTRLWEANNELGSLYCDWGWLERRRKNHEHALALYEQSITLQQQAIHEAKTHHLGYQLLDSYEDLGQVYADRCYLLLEIGRGEEATQDRMQAEFYTREMEKIIPNDYLLKPHLGLVQQQDPGNTYWLMAGKMYLWRGVWGFRDQEARDELSFELHPEEVRQATRDFILAMIYFRRYATISFQLNRTKRYFVSFLKQAEVAPEWAVDQVEEVSKLYNEDLGFLIDTINNLLGT